MGVMGILGQMLPFAFLNNLAKVAQQAFHVDRPKGLWWNPYSRRPGKYNRGRSMTDRSTNAEGIGRRALMKAGYNHIRSNGD